MGVPKDSSYESYILLKKYKLDYFHASIDSAQHSVWISCHISLEFLCFWYQVYQIRVLKKTQETSNYPWLHKGRRLRMKIDHNVLYKQFYDSEVFGFNNNA